MTCFVVVDDVSIWWQMLIFVFLCPKRWLQFNSRMVRTHFSSIMTLNMWKMIAETRSYIFGWRSRFRRRRVCLSCLISIQDQPENHLSVRLPPDKKSLLFVIIRAVFKWLSKVITLLRLLRLVIGLKESRQYFNQWEAKPKPIAPSTRDFPHASSELHVISKNPDWFMALFASVVIGRSSYFGFGCATVIWKALYSNLIGSFTRFGFSYLCSRARWRLREFFCPFVYKAI